MATGVIYQPLNMDYPRVWYGQVTIANSSNIQISSNGYVQNYYGSFTYSGSSLSGGTVTRSDYSEFGQKIYEVSGGAYNALTVNSYLIYNNPTGLLAYVFYGNDNISGSSGSDHINGYSGNDFLYGNGGNDFIRGGNGNDTIDGGTSIDTAIFTGNRTNYTQTKTASGWTINSVAEGVDTIQNVERIKFADATVALDTDGVGGQAYRIYQAAFNRTPDLGGLGYWISVMDGGASLKGVAGGFVGSDEFKSTYGVNPSNLAVVTKLYDNVLHRPGEQGGLDYWVGVLDRRDGTVAEVLAGFSESAENQAGVIGVIGNGFTYTPYG
ncbi:MAG: DUF4214 domain-containing protein [Chlorobium sp.]|nr:DUF4214 domain-containing protein [Chlorobium sp.]